MCGLLFLTSAFVKSMTQIKFDSYVIMDRCVCVADVDGVAAKRKREAEEKEEVLEMMENSENPLRWPVRLYEFYLSKW